MRESLAFLTCCSALTLAMATSALAAPQWKPGKGPLPGVTPPARVSPTPSPTPTRLPQTTPIPLPRGLVRVTVEIKPDGQPWSTAGVWEIQTQDWTRPCAIEIDSPCLVRIERK